LIVKSFNERSQLNLFRTLRQSDLAVWTHGHGLPVNEDLLVSPRSVLDVNVLAGFAEFIADAALNVFVALA